MEKERTDGCMISMNAPNGTIRDCLFTQIPGDPALILAAEQVLIDILRSDAPLSAAVRVRLDEMIQRRIALADARAEELRRMSEHLERAWARQCDRCGQTSAPPAILKPKRVKSKRRGKRK